MMIEFVGTSKVERTVTGLYSFDRAFHKTQLGIGASGLVEIYGNPHVGKSTFAYSIAAILAKQWKTNIGLLDLEGFEQDFMHSVLENLKYSGKVYIVQEEGDEEGLMQLVKHLSEDAKVGILDSVGAIIPYAEAQGDFGEANMGRRARLMAQFSRRVTKHNLGKHDKVVFFTNHEHDKLGRIPGKVTTGGKASKYLAPIRLKLWNKKISDSIDSSDGYQIVGSVEKNRYGGKGRQFQVIVLSGQGIHYGLTALFDAANLGIVSRKTTVKMGDMSFGYLRKIFKEAQDGNDEFFQPIIEALNDV